MTLTRDMIEEWKATTAEFELTLPHGKGQFQKLWVVPERTGQLRPEITLEQVIGIADVLQAFPESKLDAYTTLWDCLERTRPHRNRASGIDGGVSHSRLKTYEQCPLKYKFRYVDTLKSAPSGNTKLGTILHEALERLVRLAIQDERSGPIPLEDAHDLYNALCTSHSLTDERAHADGREAVKRWVELQGDLDHRDVLAVEQPFRLPLGDFTLTGFIDRIDYVDRSTIEVIDYKSNRRLYDTDDLRYDRQLTAYGLAARELYPWASRVRLTFWMLRHGVRQRAPERTPAQERDALAYMAQLAQQTETETTYPPKVSPLCYWCEYKHQCPAHKAIMQLETPSDGDLPATLADTSLEYEKVSNALSLLQKRKGDLEARLKESLKEQDEIEVNGVKYSFWEGPILRYPAATTAKVLRRYVELPDEWVDEHANIPKGKLEAYLKEVKKNLPKAKHALLQAELLAVTERKHRKRFQAKRPKAGQDMERLSKRAIEKAGSETST